MTRLEAFAIAIIVAVCCMLLCGPAQAMPPAILIQASDSIASAAGYAAQIQPITESDPVHSVQRQRALGGNVILWPGKWAQAVANFAALIDEAAKYPDTFTHVYMVTSKGDEIFWCGAAGICIGEDEETLLAGARMAHAHGLKTICTMLPDVILDPRFAMRDMNMCDGIAVDVYPSIRPTQPDLGACRFSDNQLENLLYCSFQKLRVGLRYTGDLGYMPQAFALLAESRETLRAHLTLQRSAICNAQAIGAQYIAPWGLYLGEKDMAAKFRFTTGEAKQESTPATPANILRPLAGDAEFEWMVLPC